MLQPIIKQHVLVQAQLAVSVLIPLPPGCAAVKPAFFNEPRGEAPWKRAGREHRGREINGLTFPPISHHSALKRATHK